MHKLSFNNSNRKIYHLTSSVAFVYAIILLFFRIYKETLYADKTWLHGFFTMFFTIISSIIFSCILVIFLMFIDKILNYKKANTLIYSYVFFLSLSSLSIILVLISSLKVYYSQQTSDNLNSLVNFAGTSSSSGILLVCSSIGLFFTGILLGNHIRKISTSKRSILFTFLGISFIIYKCISAVEAVNIIGNEIISSSLNIIIVVLIGYILRTSFDADNNTNNSQAFETGK